MSEKIKRINRELVYKGAILDIYKDTMDVGNGKIEEWDYVAHRKGAACIVPVPFEVHAGDIMRGAN